MLSIRPAEPRDDDAIWRILEPIIRGGEVFAWPRDLERAGALAMWDGPKAEVFVAEEDTAIVGTAFMKPNQLGGGAHVANGGYATAPGCDGRGIARRLCQHTLDRAQETGFRAMQFNFVVSTNERAVKLWLSMGFTTVGVLPGAFDHPSAGPVDAFVMFRSL